MTIQFTKHKDVGAEETFDSGDCFRDLNLLAHAQMIEIDTGSECGGHGRCGLDRVQLTTEAMKQVSAVTVIEKHHLSQDEINQGVRLACQCFPNENDLSISVRILRRDR